MKPFRRRFRREFAKLIRFVGSLDFATDTLAATAPGNGFVAASVAGKSAGCRASSGSRRDGRWAITGGRA